MSTKDAVIEMIRRMPDDVTTEDILAALYARYQIDQRIREVEAGEWVEPDEVVTRLARWHD